MLPSYEYEYALVLDYAIAVDVGEIPAPRVGIRLARATAETP